MKLILFKLADARARLPAFKNPILSTLSRVLWLMFEAEYKLLKDVSSGCEIIVNAYTK